MKTKVMETSITSETVSQNTVSGEMEECTKGKIPEIAKKVLRVPNKDKELTNDQGSNKERETKTEQTGKDLNRVREAFLNFIQMQEKQKKARTKIQQKKNGVRGLQASTEWEGSKETAKRKKTSSFRSRSVRWKT